MISSQRGRWYGQQRHLHPPRLVAAGAAAKFAPVSTGKPLPSHKERGSQRFLEERQRTPHMPDFRLERARYGISPSVSMPKHQIFLPVNLLKCFFTKGNSLGLSITEMYNYQVSFGFGKSLNQLKLISS